MTAFVAITIAKNNVFQSARKFGIKNAAAANIGNRARVNTAIGANRFGSNAARAAAARNNAARVNRFVSQLSCCLYIPHSFPS